MNQHPLKNSPDAALIYNLINSKPITPDAIWTMMKQLRLHIIRMLESGQVKIQKKGKVRIPLAHKQVESLLHKTFYNNL
jgi:hypothetical protein